MISVISDALHGQMRPEWTIASEREINFPQRLFFTGYAQGNPRQGETVEDAKNRLMRDAQGLLSEGIRVNVRSQSLSRTISATTNNSNSFDAVFASDVQTASDIEIVGIRSEPAFYDQTAGIIHAFAHVSRSELSGYYRSNLRGQFSDISITVKRDKHINPCAGIWCFISENTKYWRIQFFKGKMA